MNRQINEYFLGEDAGESELSLAGGNEDERRMMLPVMYVETQREKT